MNIVLVDDDIEFSNKLKVDVKLYFKQLDENINFIVLNDSFDTIKDIDQIDLIFLDVDLNFEMNGIDIGAYLKSKFPKNIETITSIIGNISNALQLTRWFGQFNFCNYTF